MDIVYEPNTFHANSICMNICSSMIFPEINLNA